MRRQRIVVVTIALLSARALSGQSLAERVATAGDGAVIFSFAARPEICGDGERSIRIGRSSYIGVGGDLRRGCIHGPVQGRPTMRDGLPGRGESWGGGSGTGGGR